MASRYTCYFRTSLEAIQSAVDSVFLEEISLESKIVLIEVEFALEVRFKESYIITDGLYTLEIVAVSFVVVWVPKLFEEFVNIETIIWLLYL